jgi:hypothetical protein
MYISVNDSKSDNTVNLDTIPDKKNLNVLQFIKFFIIVSGSSIIDFEGWWDVVLKLYTKLSAYIFDENLDRADVNPHSELKRVRFDAKLIFFEGQNIEGILHQVLSSLLFHPPLHP